MKKKISFYISIVVLCFIVFIALNSCKKTGLVSKELLLYVKGDYGSTTNTTSMSLTRTPTAIWGIKTIDIPVYATHEVPANIDVYVYPDDRFVNSYNQANSTNYVMLPPTAYKLNSFKHRINAKSLVSDPLTLEITDAASLSDTKGYILPLTVTKYESEDKGPVISTNKATVYLIIPYKFTNVDSVQAPLTGTTMSRTAWSVTVSSSSTGTANQASNLLDGNNTTVWRSASSTTAAKTVTVNLGSVQQATGFIIYPNYTNTNENATQMTISTSTDNVTYTVQGIWNGTGPAASSSATNPDKKGVNFIVPVSARYFRFDVTAWVSTSVSIVGMAEIYGVQ